MTETRLGEAIRTLHRMGQAVAALVPDAAPDDTTGGTMKVKVYDHSGVTHEYDADSVDTQGEGLWVFKGDKIGESLGQFGGVLRCQRCGFRRLMNGDRAASYTARGWPKCCGYTMRWWTQRQIDAGEVPTDIERD